MRMIAIALSIALLGGIGVSAFAPVRAQDALAAPGITAAEIKLGQTMPYTGPASNFGKIGKAEAAYFQMIGDQGGVNGRKIKLISLDDGYDPAKTVELTHKLIEEEHVALMFGSLGTSQNLAVRQYLNDSKIPQLFIATGGDVAGDYKHFPWTVGGTSVYRIEAQIFAKFILNNVAGAKIGVLYQDDDFGKAYVTGLKEVFGRNYEHLVVKEESFAGKDANIDTQLAALKAADANVLITATATGKLASQSIARTFDLGWHPLHFLPYTASSVPAILAPAGLDKSVGLLTVSSYEDPGDPRWTEDGSLKPYNDFMQKYLPEADKKDFYYLVGYTMALPMVEVLRQAGSDLSRENIMKQAANLRDFHPVGLLPGISFNTNRTKYIPIVEGQLMRFDGQQWNVFGDIMAGR